jgi:hypothetical protein
MDSLPFLLRLLIDNAMRNQTGSRSNRYEREIKQVSAFLLIRDGNSQYNFFQKNLRLPEVSTVRKFLSNEVKTLQEGVLDFDGLLEYLKSRNLSFEVAITEDGTKVHFNKLSFITHEH